MIMKAKNWHLKVSAYSAMATALYNGTIIRAAACEHCGVEPRRPLNGHHDDYAKPLEVVWLCGKCHSRMHRTSEQNKHVRLPLDVYSLVRAEAFHRQLTMRAVLAEIIRETYGLGNPSESATA